MKSLKIALVDDDKVFHFIINRSFVNLYPDCKILNFSNCADFLNFLKRNMGDTALIPDVVLMDLNTPFMSGWEFLERYEILERDMLKRPDIYLISSSIDPGDVEKARQFNSVSRFYSKPLLADQITEIMEKAKTAC